MRKTLLILAALGTMAAMPGGAQADGFEHPHHYRVLQVRKYYRHYHYAAVRNLILARNLLTPAELRCAEIRPGHKAAGQVTQVRVERRPACGLADGGTRFMFDLYLDTASGSYQWTPEEAETLQEAPYLGDARREKREGIGPE